MNKVLLKSLALAFALASVSRASVSVYYEQEGSNVRVTWSGSIVLNPVLANDTTLSAFNELWGGSSFQYQISLNNGGAYNNALGSASSTSLTGYDFHDGALNPGVPSFGFAGSNLYWNGVHISGGVVGAVSEVTFVQSRDSYLIPNVTLASIGAGSFSNNLAWTANGGDTIRYVTGSPVPEPSSVLILGVGALGFVTRRKR